MTKEEIQTKYKELILPENKAPYHFEKVEGATEVKAYNPMCGDKYTLYIKDEGIIHFHGIGCAISKASTSFMLKAIEGKTRDEMIAFSKAFIKAIDEDGNFDDFPEGLKVLGELKQHEGRVDCIQLSWKALLAHLEI